MVPAFLKKTKQNLSGSTMANVSSLGPLSLLLGV